MAEKEDPSPQGRDQSAFGDFIENLDLSGFDNVADNHLEGILDSGIREIPASKEGTFAYDLEVGSAHFRTIVDTDRWNPNVSMDFPSQAYGFNRGEMLSVVVGILGAAFPSSLPIPQVFLHDSEGTKNLNLKDYWHGKIYERALRNNTWTTISYSVDPTESLSLPASVAEHLPTKPLFIYEFNKNSYEEVREKIIMPELKARGMQLPLAGELLARNTGFDGYNEKDAQGLIDKLNYICKKHPPQTLLTNY